MAFLRTLITSSLVCHHCSRGESHRFHGGCAGKSVLPSNLTAEAKQRILAWMDPTADPCNNFYQYACGGWIANVATTPPDRVFKQVRGN